MTDLFEGQFEIDGVPFGLDLPVFVTSDGFNPGRAELLTSRTKIGGGDGVRMGSDYYGSATWSFKLATDGSSAKEALELYQSIADAWPRDDVRLESGAVVPLRYRLAGRTRIVYGRGGRFTPAVDTRLWSGLMSAAADFETIDHLHYDDEVESTTISIGEVTQVSNGVIPPFIPPFTSTGANSERNGQVTVGGERPTPVWLEFDGPVTNPQVVAVDQWIARINDTVHDDDPVTVDARPWARSATRQSGSSVQVSPRVTQISKLLLPPGDHQFIFTGTDPTGTATVTVRWRKAYPTL